MILGFKPQFKEKTLNETKIHTVRIDSKNRWKENMIIHFAIGVRTKNYECFKSDYCHSIQPIHFICKGKSYGIVIENRMLKADEIEQFAQNDGFDSIDQMWDWFKPLMHENHCFYDKYLEAKILHWTNFKYTRL